MKKQFCSGSNWHDFLNRHPYRVTLSCGAESRTLIVTNINAARQGLEPGWRVAKVDQWDPDRRCWVEYNAF